MISVYVVAGTDKQETYKKNQTLMEPLQWASSRSNEPSIGLPIDVKVVIKDPRCTQNTSSLANHANIILEEMTDRPNDGVFVISERYKDVRNKWHSYDTNEIIKHMPMITDNGVNNEKNDGATVSEEMGKENTFIDLQHVTSMEVESMHKCKDYDTVKIDRIESDTTNKEDERLESVIVVTEDINKPTEKKHTKCSGETLTRFLNELNDKKIELNDNFSEQEIKDIHEAVEQQVNLLAATIGELDSRLIIQDVIPVGSASEGTQIIRPCEYDYILALQALSTPGAVSIEPADPESRNLAFMHVRLESDHAKAVFSNLIDNNYYIRGSHWLPCLKQGLREVFFAAVYQAVKLNSRSSVIKNTGKLKIRHWKPESHGPAFTIRLVWKRRTTEQHRTMEISVDLCPALKLKRDLSKLPMPLFYRSMFADVGCIETNGSVLIMPREGMRFKVTYTETELMCTSNLSQHHRKCYKLLKFIVNGEPFPRERRTLPNILLEPFQDANTIYHTHELKTTVWKHHYKEQCTEDQDVAHCVIVMLGTIKRKNQLLDQKTYPQLGFEHDEGIRPTPLEEILSDSRIDTLLKSLINLNTTPTENYNYEAFCRAILSCGLSKCPAKTLAIISKKIFLIVLLLICVGFCICILTHGSENITVSVIGTFFYLCGIIGILFTPCVEFVKKYRLAQRSSGCTESCIDCLFLIISGISYLIGLILLIVEYKEPALSRRPLFLSCGLYLLLFTFVPYVPRCLCKKLLRR